MHIEVINSGIFVYKNQKRRMNGNLTLKHTSTVLPFIGAVFKYFINERMFYTLRLWYLYIFNYMLYVNIYNVIIQHEDALLVKVSSSLDSFEN